MLSVGGRHLIGRSSGVLEIGDRVVVGFRREHVGLRAAGTGSATTPEDCRILGSIVTSSFQGLYNEYVVDIGDGLSVRSLHQPLDLERGAGVELHIATDHVFVWNDEAVQSVTRRKQS